MLTRPRTNSSSGGSHSIIHILALIVIWLILEVPTVSCTNACSDPSVASDINTTCAAIPNNDNNSTANIHNAILDDAWTLEEWNYPWTLEELYYELDCVTTERPIHSSAVFTFLQGMYIGIVGPTNSTIALPKTSSSLHYQPGFIVPFEVRQSPGKGRGVFATANITQHTRIWTSRNTARFTNGKSYRRFLMSIPDDLACDVMVWAYVAKNDEEVAIFADLDDGSLMNSGGYVEGEDANVGMKWVHDMMAEQYEGGCEQIFFTLRDIQEGEEILCDYNDFDVPDGFALFGLGYWY